MTMDKMILADYVDRVYGWSVRHTFSCDEADELSQEILLTALRKLPGLRDDSRFEPWLWSIAKNTERAFRRSRGKARSLVSIDLIPEIPDAPDEAAEAEETESRLRLSVSRLSAIYREIILLHYYDGLSTKNISERLGIPEGTVTWRLSEARRKLKKECGNMEETALRPVKMRIDIYGSGNFQIGAVTPEELISDALSQNILWQAYEQPLSVEELSSRCGVPAFYIEDSLSNLKKRGAVIEPFRGKFLTDFAIMSDKHGLWLEENAPKAVEPLSDEIFAALTRLSADMKSVGFYRAGKSESELTYLYGAMAFSYLSAKYCKLPYPEIPDSYDGNNWRYIGHTEKEHPVRSLGCQNNSNNGSRGHFSGSQYCFAGFGWRRMITDLELNVCEDLLNGSTEDKANFASCVRDGFVSDDGQKRSLIPAFRRAEYEKFCTFVKKEFADIVPAWDSVIFKLAAGYAKLFPKHLADDAARLSRYFWFSMFAEVCRKWQESGRIERPAAGSYCDVMIERADR